jgi:hypothetical protein
MLGHSLVSQHFMEPEGSIPNLQELSTCSYPIQSTSPHLTSPRSIIILSTHLGLVLPSGLFPSGFPTNKKQQAQLQLYYGLEVHSHSVINLAILWLNHLGLVTRSRPAAALSPILVHSVLIA